MIEPPTVAPLGVPGTRIAPIPVGGLSSLVAAPPQLMLRLKKSEWRNPIVWPISWVMTCSSCDLRSHRREHRAAGGDASTYDHIAVITKLSAATRPPVPHDASTPRP